MNSIEEKEEKNGILCPWCKSETGVENTIKQMRRIIRYRRCKNPKCNRRFPTIEKNTATNSNH